jgi:hypothetical protein
VDERDPWQVTASAFPEDGSAADRLRFAVGYAILAPSGHNTQPWRFVLREDVLELRADPARSLPVVDPHDRELVISCGAALLLLRVTLRRFGLRPRVGEFPVEDDPELLARVEIAGTVEATADDHALFGAIWRRHTNRRPFDGRELPEPLVTAIRADAEREGAWLRLVRGLHDREAVGDLVARADRIQYADRGFRRELAGWVHPNVSHRRDGIPGYANGVGDLASLLAPIAIRTFLTPGGQAARDRELALGAPTLVALGTVADDRHAWLGAGQALARVLLRAQAAGVSASFLNQPIEVPALRMRLLEAVGGTGHPQVLMRMGYGPETRPTPRRPVSEVLVER